MRTVNTFNQAQIVINQILDQLNTLTTASWNRNGLKIINNGAATDPNDYVIFSQLPVVPATAEQRDQHYTQCWSNGGTAVVGSAIPPFVPGKYRTGTPMQLILAATTAPTTAPLEINLQLNGVTLLATNLSLPIGQQGPVVSSSFITPTPFMPELALVIPQIVGAASNAAAVFIGLTILRGKNKNG